MARNSVKILIDGFIETLAVEKGYSENTKICKGSCYILPETD